VSRTHANSEALLSRRSARTTFPGTWRTLRQKFIKPQWSWRSGKPSTT
jgi:hypothetical protein